MDKLWAPWRTKYVTKIIGKTKGCVFCKIAKAKNDKTNFIFKRTRYSFGVLNLYPYNAGHALVMPYRHVNDISKLRWEEQEDLLKLLNETKELLDRMLKPSGYNIGMNIGRVSGAGFPGHVHIHIVPRWKGDVNFMPVVGNTRVMSQSLMAVYSKFTQMQKQLQGKSSSVTKQRK